MATDDTRPQRIDGLTGTVRRRRTSIGSKSEREAFWIENDNGRWLLRRKDGPTYGDTQLERHVDRRVACDGFRVGNLVLTERITPLADDSTKRTAQNDKTSR